ncbi:hypothetical protein V6N13_100317 [Hibiscus sabdariffa]|uniref:Uncharacterized protein n=2 Tax=Hibiscus sabdariffa TaxID=183260 RepID=A0ABR2BGH5_9ROSI
MKINKIKICWKHRCEKCKKICKVVTVVTAAVAVIGSNNSMIFECPLYYRAFGSRQALDGHKRSDLLAAANSSKFDNNLIDLNLSTPMKDDEFSVVSNA